MSSKRDTMLRLAEELAAVQPHLHFRTPIILQFWRERVPSFEEAVEEYLEELNRGKPPCAPRP